MQFENHHKYEAIMGLKSQDIASVLQEIKTIIENCLKLALNELDLDTTSHDGTAVDRGYLLRKAKQDIYLDVVARIVSELNFLGHKLVALDQDLDTDFESSTSVWAAINKDHEAVGLAIEFLPYKANVQWVLSPQKAF